MLIENGMVIEIEPIIGETTGETKTLSNRWEFAMANGCMSPHFENTVAIYDNKPNVLTTFEYSE